MALNNFSWVLPGLLAGSDMPGANGSGKELWQDLEYLVSEGVQLLISLEQPAGQVKEICTSLGIQWHHFPVPDFGVPFNDKRFEDLVDKCVTTCVNAQPVCIHCRAGIGRTGMVLACVYGRYADVDGDCALQHIRSLRNAVETVQQRDFVLRFLRHQ